MEKLTTLRAKVLTWEMRELHPTILLDPELLFTMRLANSPILPPNQLFKHFILKRDAATSLLGGERDWRLNQPVINDLVDKACVMKPPKTPKGQGPELLGW